MAVLYFLCLEQQSLSETKRCTICSSKDTVRTSRNFLQLVLMDLEKCFRITRTVVGIGLQAFFIII